MWAHPILADGNCTGVLVIEVSRAAGPTPSMLRDLARITHVMSAAVSWHRRDAEATLARTHDRLTGLANRAAFFAALDYRAVSLHDHVIALFYVDLDDFEQKRTQWGETIGDGVLVEIGDRLRRVSRGSDLVARVGPHDFTLLCADLPSEDVVVSISERLVELLSQPFTVCGEVLRVPASVGVSTTQGHFESAALFAISTHASYRARVGDAG